MAQVEWAHLCDYAFFDQSGKPCLIGVFRTIFAPRVPAQHTRACIVMQLQGKPRENFDLRIQIIRPDKDELVGVEGRVRLNDSGRHTINAGFDNLMLPDFGPYEVRFIINGAVAYTMEFDVVRMQAG